MNKEEVIEIATNMGFNLDQWGVDNKGWIRFTLKEELDEKDMRWIWYKEKSLSWNLSRVASILFKAGQKAKLQQISEFIEL